MTRHRYFGAVLVVTTTAIGFVARAHGQEPHHAQHEWDYGKEHGPTHWGELKPEFAACASGHHQSPIDIDKTEKADLPAIQFQYAESALRVLDNGHTIQAVYDPGSSIRVGDHEYTLKQFHFHRLSEEKIHGQRHEMSLHLVHADAAGQLAVVAVLLDAGPENRVVREVWNNLPKGEGEQHRDDVKINAANLLPAERGYYTFEGSLTTPPCTENVTWFVLKQPVRVSPDEIAEFAKRYTDDARPTQPLYDRVVKESR